MPNAIEYGKLLNSLAVHYETQQDRLNNLDPDGMPPEWLTEFDAANKRQVEIKSALDNGCTEYAEMVGIPIENALRYAAAIIKFNDYCDANPGAAPENDSFCQSLFLDVVMLAPKMKEAIFGDILPKPTHCDSEGRPVYTVEEVAESLGVSVAEVQQEAVRLDAAGLSPLFDGEVFTKQ